MCGFVHSEDFAFAGSKEHLQHIARHMETEFYVKVMMMGPGAPNELRVLSRSIKWTETASSTKATTDMHIASSKNWVCARGSQR